MTRTPDHELLHEEAAALTRLAQGLEGNSVAASHLSEVSRIIRRLQTVEARMTGTLYDGPRQTRTPNLSAVNNQRRRKT